MGKILRTFSKSLTHTFAHQNEHKILEICTPPVARKYIVTRVTVLGADDNSQSGLIAAVYIGDAEKANPLQVVQHALTIPYTTTVNEKAFIVSPNETLFVYIEDPVGNLGTLSVVANAQVSDYNEQDLIPRWI